ncbi:MAG: hypothetical protein ACI4DS_03510 [Eubacterium sp.]
MKKHAYLICFICLVVLFICIYIGGYFYSLNFTNSNNITKSDEIYNSNPTLEQNASTTAVDNGYWIATDGDNIIIYCADRETVYFDTQIPLSSLTQSELAVIESGLYVEDISVILQYLESYTS